MKGTSFSKDFLLEVMQDSQRLKAEALEERQRWLRTLAVDGREEVLFEFELLLRGLERYFHLHNLPIADERTIMARDFKVELRVVRDTVMRAAQLTRLLLDAPSDRTLVFQRFVQSQLADDTTRSRMLEQSFSQGTPQESLFMLRQGFVALRGVIDALLRLPHTTYAVFRDVGQLALQEIALSRYFRPFGALEFRPEYDRIKSVRILDVLRGISDEEARRALSLAFLGLFRLLHYLRYVTAVRSSEAVPRGQLVMALVKSEATSLSFYLSGELCARLARIGPEPSEVAARVAMELRKDAGKVLRRDLPRAVEDPAALLRAQSTLETRVKQAVVPLARAFDRSIRGTSLFDDYITRREQARRLLSDLLAFREICARAAAELAEPGDVERALRHLRSFVSYFQDVSYQLLRFGDFEPFDGFINALRAVPSPMSDEDRGRLSEVTEAFTATLDTTLSQVGRREELRGHAPDADALSELIQRFWAAAG